RSTSETCYLSQRKKQFNDKTKTLLFFIRERKRKEVANGETPLSTPKKKEIYPRIKKIENLR
ncbi:hypothetical protein, partial [Avibacterium endocarditidis]|uniref:hypothetical protein n=1 Tax=Avibacterium endocarditidis TaxID=380674 RepID=UPI001CA5A250